MAKAPAARLADPATWKDLVFLFLQLPLGIASFVIAVVVLGVAVAFLAAPAYYWAVPDGLELGIMQADTLLEALALVPVGALVAFVGIPAARPARPRVRRARRRSCSAPDPTLS